MQKNRQEAQAIMQELGYGPDNPLPVNIRHATLQSIAAR